LPSRTYEYGYAYLTPWLGFTAGWMFLCAKTASAATAALGFAGYLLQALGVEGLMVPVAIAAAATLTANVVAGIRHSNRANIVIVSTTLFALTFFIVAGSLTVWSAGSQPCLPFFRSSSDNGSGPTAALFHATALMFVAFTGYARIATLGEEVREPRRTIPRAIIVTLILSGALYFAVGAVGISTIGPEGMAEAAQTEVAPLEVAARTFGIPCLALLGDVKTTWSFSAFTVLIYYAITNLAALRLRSGCIHPSLRGPVLLHASFWRARSNAKFGSSGSDLFWRDLSGTKLRAGPLDPPRIGPMLSSPSRAFSPTGAAHATIDVSRRCDRN
jgi:amino acid transporter